MTECIELGTKKNDHGQNYYTYRMAAGEALLIDDDKRTTEKVKVTEAMAKQAKDQEILRFINNKTVVVFEIEGRHYAQRLPIKEGTYVGKVKQAAPQRRPSSRRPSGVARPADPAANDPKPTAPEGAVGLRPAQAGDRGPQAGGRTEAVRREAPRRARYEPL